ALGVGPPLLRRIELEAFQQARAALGVEPAPQPPQQVDDLAARERGPQRDIAGHVGEPPVQLHRLAPGVAPEQDSAAGIGPQEPEQDADRRGLARAVGPEEPVHLAGRHGEVEPVQCLRVPEGLVEPGDLDGRPHALHATPSRASAQTPRTPRTALEHAAATTGPFASEPACRTYSTRDQNPRAGSTAPATRTRVPDLQ